MSEVRAVINLFSNIVATIVVSKWMGELTGEHLRLAFDDGAGDVVATSAKLKGWSITPSHFIGQDLTDVGMEQ
jgi:hypothetical protein